MSMAAAASGRTGSAAKALENKVAIVTGAGTGIGAAVARRFAVEGASVVLMGRTSASLEEVAAQTGGVASPGDSARTSDVQRAVDRALERFGGLDVVVANAGSEGGGAALDADDAAWVAGLRNNLTGAFVIAREAIPGLVESRSGSIVIVSSIAALASVPGMTAYNTAKAGLLGLTRSLAIDYGPEVRVNAVCPGWIRTPMADREMDSLAEQEGISREDSYARVTAPTPLRRPGTPEEIAAVCLFLASAEASFVTGSIFIADGGTMAVNLGTLPFAGA
jgi:meso-butanediol dehydrogenase / (S,S)-butanediol dehydrogenase / diacetyl reductase